MPQHVIRRQPLSCENCRKRKVKCEPKDQVTIPCSTCVKRGHAKSCFFKRSEEQVSQVSNEGELLSRIRNLEELLKQQIAQSSESPSSNRPGSTPAMSDETSQIGADTVSVRAKRVQVGTIVASASGYQHLSLRTSLDTSLLQQLVEGDSGLAGGTNFPFNCDPVNTSSMLLDILPPVRQCDELKNVFFEVFSPLFHLLHDPTFHAIYDRFRQEPATVSLSWLALLFVVLAIAVTALDESHSLLQDLARESSAVANIKKLSARYRSAAMQCLAADQFLYRHNLQTLQALVLLIYAMNHANVSSWSILGMTWSMAVKIGLHIDPSKLGLGIVEGEERRRCWAALMMLYTVQNTCMGNVAPQIIAADVDLPADRDDEELDTLSTTERGPMVDHPWPTRMSYLLYKFRLYKIAAEICQLDLDLSNKEKIFALDQKLAGEEHQHATRFLNRDLPVYHVVHHFILQSYTHHLYLILHRTSLAPTIYTNGDNVVSRQRCKVSAITILEVHEKLYNSPEFRSYRWYVLGLGSFHAFLAVSVLLVLSSTGSTMEYESSHLLELVEGCIKRFEIMADRSDICAKAAVIVRQVMPSHKDSVRETPAGNTAMIATQPEASNHQYWTPPTAPAADSRYINMNDWASNPGLEALLFEMASEQWMTPNSFTWDHWNNMVFV